jgi:ribosomal protein S24E
VSKAQIKSKLAETLKSKEENISIFGLKTKFGGGRSTGFALIYDSLDARKKFDSKKGLRKVGDTLPPRPESCVDIDRPFRSDHCLPKNISQIFPA